MSFLAGHRLWLLLVPLALAVAYLLAQRRRTRYVLRLTTVDMLPAVAPDRPGWRRHLPAVAVLASLTTLGLAFARPAMAMQVPRELATVVLAVDTSISMEATDVDPSRLEAAQRAATEFVELVPEGIRLGLVSFSGVATAVVAPTENHAEVTAAIDRLVLAPGTAIGEAIFAGLDVIDASTPSGDDAPATIVLLSDGETTVGRPDAEAAAAAVEAGVPVAAVAFGTDTGTVVVDGETIPVPVNESALRDVAEGTNGEFFEAGTADELLRVFDTLGNQVGFETEQREVTDWFAGAGLLLAALGAVGSLTWFSRLP